MRGTAIRVITTDYGTLVAKVDQDNNKATVFDPETMKEVAIIPTTDRKAMTKSLRRIGSILRIRKSLELAGVVVPASSIEVFDHAVTAGIAKMGAPRTKEERERAQLSTKATKLADEDDDLDAEESDDDSDDGSALQDVGGGVESEIEKLLKSGDPEAKRLLAGVLNQLKKPAKAAGGKKKVAKKGKR
jgi:hypothetical protein